MLKTLVFCIGPFVLEGGMFHVLLLLVHLRCNYNVLRVKYNPLALLHVYPNLYSVAPGLVCVRRSIVQQGRKNIALLSDYHFNSKA